jgi:ATP-dependent 26S proteasome regulatory subunit
MSRTLTETLYAILRSTGENAPGLDEKVNVVQRVRRDPDESRNLDEFLIGELTRLHAALEEAKLCVARSREKQAELAQEIEKTHGVPLHEAFFVEMVETSGRQLAMVAHRGGRHLAELSDDLQSLALAAGDAVFLAQDLSLIIGKGHNGSCVGETATVQRRLSRDRVVIRDRDTDMVIYIAGVLAGKELQPGDQVLWRRDVGMAYEIVPVESTPSFISLEEILDTPPRPLGGLQDTLRRITSMFTLSFVAPELAARYGVSDFNKSLLFDGPPGTGKTSAARHIAYHVAQKTGVACRFASVNGAELESPWVGETQRNVRQLFQSLNEYDGPAILYIDEVEAIARHRGEMTGHHSDKFLSQWLTCLDGFKRRDRVAVIASTNRKDLVDPALLERISGVAVHIGRPSRDGAREIFEIYLPESVPFHGNGRAPSATRRGVIDSAVARMFDPNADTDVAVVRFRDGRSRSVAARELVSGRLIEQISQAARQQAFERHAGGGEEGVSHRDIEEAVADAIERLATTLTVRNVRHYVTDLPQDVDVVAVDPVRRKVRRHRYLVS